MNISNMDFQCAYYVPPRSQVNVSLVNPDQSANGWAEQPFYHESEKRASYEEGISIRRDIGVRYVVGVYVRSGHGRYS